MKKLKKILIMLAYSLVLIASLLASIVYILTTLLNTFLLFHLAEYTLKNVIMQIINIITCGLLSMVFALLAMAALYVIKSKD